MQKAEPRWPFNDGRTQAHNAGWLFCSILPKLRTVGQQFSPYLKNMESIGVMLTFYGCNQKGPLAYDLADGIPPGANWIDAFNPTDTEIAFLERAFSMRIPVLADLEEIETSSRLAMEGKTIVMSLSAAVRDETGFADSAPVGFVMTKDRLLTLRYRRQPSFESLAKQVTEKGEIHAGGDGATITILEIMIDHLADSLERIGSSLNEVSRNVFANDVMAGNSRHPRATNVIIRDMLRTVGRGGDLASKVSETLLGISRMIPYITFHAADLSQDSRTRLDSLAQDAKSLNDHEERLTNKAQFLLDSLLGFTNIEQNNVFRVLTVVSVVGIPPTFFVSMWGMNFKTMPELDWAYGYTMGLSVIAISAIAPALWFKVKGWW